MSEESGGMLPAGWQRVRLGEIAQINPPLDRCVVNDDVSVTFVPMRAVEPEGGGLSQPETRRYGDVKKGYTSFLSGDVIMAKITPCMENGKTTLVPEFPGQVCFGSTEFHSIRAEYGVQGEWIASFLLQHEVRRDAQRHMAGAVGQMRVPSSFLQDLTIPLAPCAEQTRIQNTIDELLSDLDAGVAELEHAREKLKLYRASILKAAVEGALTAGWRAQHPHTKLASVLLLGILAERRKAWESCRIAEFRASGKDLPKNWRTKYREPKGAEGAELPDLPASWCWSSLEQLGVTEGGLQKTPSRAPVDRHYPYLRVGNVLRGALDLNLVRHFELSDVELERFRLEIGDVLIVEGNGSRTEIGRCAVWNGEIMNCVHQNHIIRLRPVRGLMSSFAAIFLNSPIGQQLIQRVASSTSGLYTLSVAKIEALPFPLPPEKEQEAIVEAVEDQLSVIDHLEADIETKLKSAQSLRQSILRHAFSGKLVPQDPNDEPAAELLKRIAAERAARSHKPAAAKRPAKPAPGRRTAKRGRPRKILELA